jgi:N-acetylneuraminate lyase
MTHAPLEGLIAAPFTAFHPDGALNLDIIEKQAQSLAANDVRGAFICGTTGEAVSLTIAERQQIADRWRAVAGSQLRLVVQVGDTCLDDCKTLARHAAKIRADAFSCFAPCFYKPASVEDLVDFAQEVADAAPTIPFYFYHIPSMTGVNFDMSAFLEIASRRIKNLVGIKFTHDNLVDYLTCLQLENSRFDMVYGRDEALLAGLANGARGAIGSTYNIGAPIYNRLIAAFKRNDLAAAREEQHRGIQLIKLLGSYGFIPAAKATMGLLGLDLGPTRLPLRALNKSQTDKLAGDLDRIGYFKWLK